MYPMLESLIAERNIRLSEICKALEIDAKTLWNKRRGKTDFTLSEALKIQSVFFPDIPLEELFQRE